MRAQAEAAIRAGLSAVELHFAPGAKRPGDMPRGETLYYGPRGHIIRVNARRLLDWIAERKLA
jgi:hypothetical protein